MHHPFRRHVQVALLLACWGTAALADAGITGISGRIVDVDGQAVGGASVTVVGSSTAATQSDHEGRYLLPALAPGAHDLTITLGSRRVGVQAVMVEANRLTEVETIVDWTMTFADELTVRAVSRYPQRLVEAPAAVTSLTSEAIERRAAHGQLPRLLASTASAELAQGGLYDFNLNTRGFNGSTNRRVLTLIDGRDPSLPVFSGAQEWAAFAFGIDRLQSMELVRGPGAALYGAGAFNGVLDLRTRPVAASRGGRLRLTGGELSTRRFELLQTTASERLGAFEAQVGVQQSQDFLRSRVSGGEYLQDQLPAEIIPPPDSRVSLWTAQLRYRRDLAAAWSLEAEGGSGRLEGAAVVAGVGRLQRLDVHRPWLRFELAGPHGHVLSSYTGRDSDGEISLATGGAIYLDSSRWAAEAQGHTSFASGRGRAIGGLSWSRLEVDSKDPSGVQTIFAAPVDSNHQAAFGQAELGLGPRLLAVASLRWDDSDLHDARWSPRAAVVLSTGDHGSLRLTWSEAFQSPTLSEKGVRVAVAPPLDLSPLETALEPLLGGLSLGLDAIPLLAVGNPELRAEEIETWEIGYTGTLGRHCLISLSAYQSELSGFTSNLIPVLGTGLGPLLDLPRWRPPAGLSAQASDAVEAALAAALPPGFLLAADAEGRPYIPLLSFGSFGRVDTEGAEASLSAELRRWRFEASASWFDHQVRLAAAENPLSANRAPWQAALSLGFVDEDWDLNLDWRWSDRFDYRSGVFVGPVPSFAVLDFVSNAHLSERWKVGLAITNLLDNRHWEAFGGDLIGRVALAQLAVSW